MLDADSTIMEKLKANATGVNVELVNDKAIKVDGPIQKVERLLEGDAAIGKYGHKQKEVLGISF